jgi:hypothetical protein
MAKPLTLEIRINPAAMEPDVLTLIVRITLWLVILNVGFGLGVGAGKLGWDFWTRCASVFVLGVCFVVIASVVTRWLDRRSLRRMGVVCCGQGR